MEQSLICYFYTKTMSHITHIFINFIIHIIYYSKMLNYPTAGQNSSNMEKTGLNIIVSYSVFFFLR